MTESVQSCFELCTIEVQSKVHECVLCEHWVYDQHFIEAASIKATFDGKAVLMR